MTVAATGWCISDRAARWWHGRRDALAPGGHRDSSCGSFGASAGANRPSHRGPRPAGGGLSAKHSPADHGAPTLRNLQPPRLSSCAGYRGRNLRCDCRQTAPSPSAPQAQPAGEPENRAQRTARPRGTGWGDSQGRGAGRGATERAERSLSGGRARA